MSILRAAAKLMIREFPQYGYRDPVLTLGVPEVHATAAELADWFPQLAQRACALAPGDFTLTTNAIGARRRWIDGRSFLRTFGLRQIDSLDIPGSEHAAEILHDLNGPLPATFHGRYNLVLDPGTLEHVFDVRTCLVNIQRALAVGGTVIHLVPVYSYNGGYYSINPNVLRDFYTLNGFEHIRAYLLMWDRYRAYSAGRTRCYEYREDVLGARHALADRDQVRYTPHLLLFARKREHVSDPASPLQFGGDYTGQATAPDAARGRSLERFGKRWAPLMNRLVPFGLAQYLQTLAYRNLVLLRARREAGFWI